MAKQATFGFEENGEPVVRYEVDADGIGLLTLNRAKAGNAVHDWMYTLVTKHLGEAASDPTCKAVVITGAGRLFCAGADLEMGFDPMVGALKSMKGAFHDPVGRFMLAVIRFPKLLVAAVNGPAVGVGATLLPHCDLVYMADNAFLSTPFVTLSAVPEFCSSYLFPKVLGHALGHQMLYLGKRVTAEEANAAGLVSAIIPAGPEFVETVKSMLRPTLATQLSMESLVRFKGMIKPPEEVSRLERIHEAEMKALDERSIGDDSDIAKAIKVFYANRAKASSKSKSTSSSKL